MADCAVIATNADMDRATRLVWGFSISCLWPGRTFPSCPFDPFDSIPNVGFQCLLLRN